MSFKVQINSLDALNRLLGDPSPEMMIEIRGSIIQEFAKAHIKTLAKLEIDTIKSATKEAVREVAEDHLGKYGKADRYSYKDTFQLKEDIQAAIKKAVEEQIAIDIKEQVNTYLDNKNIDAMIAKIVDYRTKILIEEKVKEGVREQWNKIKSQIED